MSPAGPLDSSPTSGLDRIRTCLERWLDHLEMLARSLPDPDEIADLRQRLSAAEAERDRMQAESERRDREWRERLETLEDDRRLLAEAWERLEREQVAMLSAGSRPPRPHSAEAPTLPPTPQLATPADGAEGAAMKAILRQFEALRDDVRHRSDSRRA